MRLPRSVLVYPFRRSAPGWEVLLLRRVARPDLELGGFWQGVTGALERGETTMQAAARELREETGFTAHRLEAIDYRYTFPISEAWRHDYAPGEREITEHVCLAIVNDADAPALSGEHDAWKWCPLESAITLLHWPENIEALRRCIQQLV